MRYEFKIAVKRAALARSGGICEAVGARYGHAPGVRCKNPVATGRVQYDHYPRGARDPHPDTTSLENCWATCPKCNQYAANHTDKQREWKIKDVRRFHGLDPDERKKGSPIRTRKTVWPKRAFQKRAKP